MDDPIAHRPERHRFEAMRDGRPIGELVYRLDEGVMTIAHTEVDPAFEGQGIAGALVQAALAHARGERLKVQPTCPYADAYMERHPDTAPLRAGSDLLSKQRSTS